MAAGLDFAQVGEGDHHADGSVTAHAQASTVVEENHARDAVCQCGLAEARTHHGLRAARLGNQGATERFVIPLKNLPPLLKVRVAEIGPPFDDGAGGLASSV
jgi:hypothetical protein